MSWNLDIITKNANISMLKSLFESLHNLIGNDSSIVRQNAGQLLINIHNLFYKRIYIIADTNSISNSDLYIPYLEYIYTDVLKNTFVSLCYNINDFNWRKIEVCLLIAEKIIINNTIENLNNLHTKDYHTDINTRILLTWL